MGLGKLGATTSIAWIRRPETSSASAWKVSGAGELADGRQRTRSTRTGSSGARASKTVTKVDAPDRRARDSAIPTKKFAGTYGSAMSKDGRYFGGGAWPRDGVSGGGHQDRAKCSSPTPARTPARRAASSIRSGQLLGRRSRRHAGQVRHQQRSGFSSTACRRPTRRIYTAHVGQERRGLGRRNARRAAMLRFNPKTEQWTEYVLPEPYGIDRETWIDNSTDPVTVWYVDHEGWIVRIQPLE